MASLFSEESTRDGRAEVCDDSIFAILRGDHREIANLFALLVAETSTAELRQRTFRRLCVALISHTRAEEETFYPRLLGAEATPALALAFVEDHHLVRKLLAQILGLSCHDAAWLPKVQILRVQVEHHVEEEEGKLFSEARRLLSDDEKRGVGHAFLKSARRHAEIAEIMLPATDERN